MRVGSCTPGSVLHLLAVLPALLLALEASCVPVVLGETSTPSSESLADTGPVAPTASPVRDENTPPAGGSGLGMPGARRAGPNVAAGPAPMAGTSLDDGRDAGAKRTLPNPDPQRVSAGAKPIAPVPVRGNDGDIEIDPELTEAAKTALRWAHDAKQWTQPTRPGAEGGAYTDAEAAGAVATELARAAADARRSMAANPALVGAGPEGTEGSRQYDRPGAANINFVQEGLRLIRDIAEHPVTWLLMPVLVFAIAVVWVVQYRALADKRGVGGRSNRGQRALPTQGRPRRKDR